MDINIANSVKVFRNEKDDKVSYWCSVQAKDINGNTLFDSLPLRFKRGTEIKDGTPIYIRGAKLTFYKEKETNKSRYYLVVYDWITVAERIAEAHIDIEVKNEIK